MKHRRSGGGAFIRPACRTLAAFGCGVFALALGGSAEASDASLWLVTRVDVGSAKPAEIEASRRLTQLLRARGLDVLDGASASSEFERKHSRTARTLPPAEVAELDASVRKLADELASENLSAAQKLIADIDALSPDIRDQLNHEKQRSRRRFHICLLAAHLFSKEGFKEEAFQQIRKCARDFPGLEPESGPYLPESIREFFGRAHQELERIRPSTVHVDVENGSAKDCRARINGIDRGPTPATVEEVRTERVRIEVDCGQRNGRIYDVGLEPGDNSFRIDLELDRAVQTEPDLGLRYADTQAAANNRLLHTLRLARAVGASSVLQIWNGELHRIDVAARRDTSLGELKYPLEELIEGLEAQPEAPSQSSEAPELATNAGDGEGIGTFATLGWVAAGAAVLAGGGVIVAWRVREGAVKEFNALDQCSRWTIMQDEACPDFLDSSDAAESAMWVLGFSGIALAGLATTFFLIDEDDSRESAQGCGIGPGDLGVACRFRF